MSCDLSHPAEADLLRLSGKLTIYTAAASRQHLLEQLAALPAEAPRRLDLSEISEIDTSGLQLLLALRRSAPTLTLVASSPAIDHCLRLSGLASLLPTEEV